MTARREKTLLRKAKAEGRFIVECRRARGAWRPWMKGLNQSRDQAELVSRRLCKIGCPSRIVDTKAAT